MPMRFGEFRRKLEAMGLSVEDVDCNGNLEGPLNEYRTVVISRFAMGTGAARAYVPYRTDDTLIFPLIIERTLRTVGSNADSFLRA